VIPIHNLCERPPARSITARNLLRRALNTCLPSNHHAFMAFIKLPISGWDWQGDCSEKALATFYFVTHTAKAASLHPSTTGPCQGKNLELPKPDSGNLEPTFFALIGLFFSFQFYQTREGCKLLGRKKRPYSRHLLLSTSAIHQYI